MTKLLRFLFYLASMLVLALVLLAPRPLEAGSSKASYEVLYSFQQSPDAEHPEAGPIIDSHGTLYGTAAEGGAFGYGAVFSVAPNGQETVLYSFAAPSDGCNPTSSLVEDSSGNLYGTTISCGAYYHGTVFKVDTTGVETVLYSFCPQDPCPDGAAPYGALVLDAQGNLFGTTQYGGVPNCNGDTCGTVFRIDATGEETVLYAFTGGADGARPMANLMFDADGNLYGTTYAGGGTGCYGNGCGTVFKVNSSGKETVLYRFKNAPDGAQPYGGLIADIEGNLYGETIAGGYTHHGFCSHGCGTAFRLTPAGKETVLYRFNASNGEPSGGLVRDTTGNFYGTALGGSGCGGGCGLVFELGKAGKLTVLHKFTKGGGGRYPSTLARDPAGVLYGATLDGGTGNCPDGGGGQGCGIVFKLTPWSQSDGTN